MRSSAPADSEPGGSGEPPRPHFDRLLRTAEAQVTRRRRQAARPASWLSAIALGAAIAMIGVGVTWHIGFERVRANVAGFLETAPPPRKVNSPIRLDLAREGTNPSADPLGKDANAALGPDEAPVSLAGPRRGATVDPGRIDLALADASGMAAAPSLRPMDVFKRFNCTFSAPGEPWRRLSGLDQDAGELVAFGMGRDRHAAPTFVLQALPLGSNSGISRHNLDDFTRSTLASEWGGNDDFPSGVFREMNGLVFRRYPLCRNGSHPEQPREHAELWTTEKGGIIFRLWTVAPAGTASVEDMERWATEMAVRFRILNAELEIHAADFLELATVTVSARKFATKPGSVSVTVEPPAVGWLEWPSGMRQFLGAEYAATDGDGHYLALATMAPGSAFAPPEDLVGALLAVWLNPTHATVDFRRKLTFEHGTGIQIDGSATLPDAPVQYRLQVVRSESTYILLLGLNTAGRDVPRTGNRGGGDPGRLFERVRFKPADRRPDGFVEAADPRRAYLAGALAMALGDAATRFGSHQTAAGFYRKALDQRPGDFAALRGLSDALAADGQLKQALTLLDSRQGEFDRTPGYLAFRARLLALSGEIEAGNDLLTDLVRNEFVPPADGVAYLDALIERKAYEAGLAVVAALQRKQPRPEWDRFKADLLAALGYPTPLPDGTIPVGIQ